MKARISKRNRPFKPSVDLRSAHRRARWYIQRHYSPEIFGPLVGVHDNTARRWYAEYWQDKYPKEAEEISDGGRHIRTVAHILMLIKGLPVKTRQRLLHSLSGSEDAHV